MLHWLQFKLILIYIKLQTINLLIINKTGMQYWQYRSLGTSTVTAVANMGIVYLVYAIFDTGLQIHAMYCLDSQAT
jgi:hypothetical protein